MAEKGRLFTGARARFSIDGIKVGYARGVNVSEAITYEPVTVLDNIEVEEHVPTGYEVTFTCSMFRIIGTTLKSRGWFPPNGANTEEHLENILITGDLIATVEDTKTGKLFATLEQVKISSHNWTVDAIRIKDESET